MCVCVCVCVCVHVYVGVCVTVYKNFTCAVLGSISLKSRTTGAIVAPRCIGTMRVIYTAVSV